MTVEDLISALQKLPLDAAVTFDNGFECEQLKVGRSKTVVLGSAGKIRHSEIKGLLHEKWITQRELARQVGISEFRMSRILSGRFEMRAVERYRIFKIINSTVRALEKERLAGRFSLERIGDQIPRNRGKRQ